MTKAERAALRAIAERDTFTTFATELKISELANAVPKLLDALEASEVERAKLRAALESIKRLSVRHDTLLVAVNIAFEALK